jgi:acyl-coenzyme A synthetase/AMP-(fatty) acid ligase
MITGAIFDWAKRTPEKIALTYNGQAWSYRAFAQAIAICRGHFRRQGIAGEGVAVIALNNLRDFWVVSLALRSLGLTTLAAQSASALREIGLPDVRGVIASPDDPWAGFDATCAELGLRVLPLTMDGGPALGLEPAPTHRPGGHILQTSGTTGVYKKVLFDPAFETAFMRQRRAVNGVDRNAVVNMFEFGGWTGMGYKCPVAAWFAGASVVIHQGLPPHEALRHPGITHTTMIPTLLATVLAAPEGAFPRSETMRLAVGGGAISQGLMDQAKARITPHVFNRVGSTEVGTFCYTRLDTPEDRRWHTIAPGRVVQIVDEHDRPTPIGVEGRVRVSTTDCPTDYMADPAASRAFFKDGFFYPGDLGVLREDGRLALHGRITDVVNLAGQKLPPAPIEDRLREALGVAEVCLLSMQDEAGDERVHVVLEAKAPVAADRLAASLRAELPGIAEANVRYVTALPRNAMGKVQRQTVRAQIAALQAPPAPRAQRTA